MYFKASAYYKKYRNFWNYKQMVDILIPLILEDIHPDIRDPYLNLVTYSHLKQDLSMY